MKKLYIYIGIGVLILAIILINIESIKAWLIAANGGSKAEKEAEKKQLPLLDSTGIDNTKVGDISPVPYKGRSGFTNHGLKLTKELYNGVDASLEVKELQYIINKVSSANLSVDGKFGAKTEAALQALINQNKTTLVDMYMTFIYRGNPTIRTSLVN